MLFLGGTVQTIPICLRRSKWRLNLNIYMELGRGRRPRNSGFFIEIRNSAPTSRFQAVFAVGIGCGLRRSEIASLTNANIKYADQSICLVGKGNKERKVFCSPDVCLRLTTWLSSRDSRAGSPEPNAPVFCSIRKADHIRSTEPLTDDGIYRMMTRRAEQLGIQDFSPHDLRRTYVTRLLQMGGDINVVRQAMGHASIATTQRYDRRGEDEVRRLVCRLSI